MSDLISGIYGLLNDPTKKERNQLGSLGGYETGTGEGNVTAASKYYQGILSGSPTLEAEALAPEISAGQRQIQEGKNQLAEFAPRTGGTAAESAGMDAAGRANIINLLGGLKTSAASGAGSLGSNMLGQASGNISTEADLAHQRYMDTLSAINSTVKGAAGIAMPFLAGPAAAAPGMASQLTNLPPEMGAAPADFSYSDLQGLEVPPDLSVFA